MSLASLRSEVLTALRLRHSLMQRRIILSAMNVSRTKQLYTRSVYLFQVLWTTCLPRSPPPSRRSSAWWHLWTLLVWWTETWSIRLMSTVPSHGWVCSHSSCLWMQCWERTCCVSLMNAVFSPCRRTGRPDIRILRPDGPGAVQTHAQHCGEAQWEMWRQADVLPEQGRWSGQGNGQTGEMTWYIHFWTILIDPITIFLFIYLWAEGDDADRAGTLSPSRSQQMWFWNADNIHPWPTKGTITVLCIK